MASKYKKGEVIGSLDELMNEDVIWYYNKILNIGFFQNWQIRFALTQIKYGRIFKTVLKEKGD